MRATSDHTEAAELFYYPYATIWAEGRTPFLNAVALYFDKVHVLDPEKAIAGSIGLRDAAAADVLLLEQAGILERVAPQEMLSAHGEQIVRAVHEDLLDPEYRRISAMETDRDGWLLALAKTPSQVAEDEKLRRLISIPPPTGEPILIDGPDPRGDDYYERAPVGQRYVEGSVTGGTEVEFRYRSLPLPLGESIMINHALFGSLLRTGATPFSDDPFHYRVLNHKMERARRIPEVRRVLEDRARQRQIKADVLAATTLMDKQLDLPALAPGLPLEVLLEYRDRHRDDLARTRKELARLAREIRHTPWSDAFADEMEHTTIPAIDRELGEAKKARDSWLRSKGGRRFLEATGATAATAATTLSLVLGPAPQLPLAAVASLLGLIGATVPAWNAWSRWLEERSEVGQNGLHYLIKLDGR